MRTQTIPDIEQAALNILERVNERNRPTHPLLRAYVEAIVSDPRESRSIDSFPLSQSVVESLSDDPAFRQPSPGESWYRVFADGDPLDPDATLDGEPRFSPFQSACDVAVSNLANAVAHYRADGRPEHHHLLTMAVSDYAVQISTAYSYLRRAPRR